MSSSERAPWLLVAAILCVCPAAASPRHVTPVTEACPSLLNGPSGQFHLVNASLFDGPPDQAADLQPVPAGDMDRWSLDGVDPYLVCRYGGTARTVTLHPKRAAFCEAGGKPFHAGCKLKA